MAPAKQLAATKPDVIKKADCTRKLPWQPQLKQLRETLKLSLDEVAEAVQLSKSALWELEQGGDPLLSTAARLAEFFGKPIAEIWVVRGTHSVDRLAICGLCFGVGKYGDYCPDCTTAWCDVGYFRTLDQALAAFPNVLSLGLPETLQAEHSQRAELVKQNLNVLIQLARRVKVGSDEQKELNSALQKGR